MAFTEALKVVMAQKSLRAVDIANDQVKAPYISRLLNGKVKEPTWQKALAILDSVGISPDEFYEIEKGLSTKESGNEEEN